MRDDITPRTCRTPADKRSLRPADFRQTSQEGPVRTAPSVGAATTSVPETAEPQGGDHTGPSKTGKPRFLLLFAFLSGLFILAVLWYVSALRPVAPADSTRQRIDIAQGMPASAIGQLLQEKGLIRSRLAFDIHTRLIGVRARLQAGRFNLSPSESLPAIVSRLLKGRADQMSITFYPGAILSDPSPEQGAKRTDVSAVLAAAGFSEAEITRAFNVRYEHPLFAGKPEGTTLEGYVFGETYSVDAAAGADTVLETAFNQFYKVLQDNGMIDKFAARKLTLYQAITLASIIQREVTDPEDQRKVAQVFFKRLDIGMPLGSDVTYMYAAKQTGAPATPELDSPYNTRKVTGLPPGPISVPGTSALRAVASPAATDYLYFLSGDDGKTYFARTNEEHEQNIKKYCQKMCSL